MNPEATPFTPDCSIDEIIANDDRLRCLFGEAIVVTERRSDIDRTPVEINPVQYCQDLGQKLNHFREHFDKPTVREEFLRAQTSEPQTLTSLETKFTSSADINLIDSIPDSHVKQWKTIEVCGAKFSIPMIETVFLEKYEKSFSLIVSMQLEQIAAQQSLQGNKIDSKKTLIAFSEIAKTKQRGFARDPRRTDLSTNIIVAIMFSELLKHQNQRLTSLLKTRTILDDELTSGMFIQLNKDETDENNPSMIKSNAVGVELKVIYNLTLRQMHQLIKYCFSRAGLEKTEAKIELLSSSRSEIRNDIATNPNRVLEHAFREHFLTRREVLDVMFTHIDKLSQSSTYRCPSCRIVIAPNHDGNFPHRRCPIVDWLVTKLQFNYSDGVVSIPDFAYVAPGISRYAREAYGLQSKLQTEPFYGKSKDEFVAYILDDRGRPIKTAHQGVKTVRLDQPSTSSRR